MFKTPIQMILDPRKNDMKIPGYVNLAAAVFLAGVAAFSGTPAVAQGSMAPPVRVIVVSPSIQSFGETRENRQMKAWIGRDNNEHRNDMELEQLRSMNERALEADRAYYKKLEWQRKNRK